MGELFEELGNAGERLGATLYPYRVLVLGVAVAVVVAIVALVVRRGWHRAMWRHKALTAVGGVALVAVLGPVLFYLGSPLFTRSVIQEASPLAAAAVPSAQATATQPAPTAPTPMRTSAPATLTPETTTTQTPTTSPTATATATPGAPTPTPTATPFSPRVLATGEFHGADEFHFGEGTAILIESEPGVYVVRFEDFSVRNGPDLFVYLSPDPDGYTDAAVNIGALRATDGNYNNPVPPEVDVASVRSVVVWCRQFAVQFAVAELAPDA